MFDKNKTFYLDLHLRKLTPWWQTPQLKALKIMARYFIIKTYTHISPRMLGYIAHQKTKTLNVHMKTSLEGTTT